MKPTKPNWEPHMLFPPKTLKQAREVIVHLEKEIEAQQARVSSAVTAINYLKTGTEYLSAEKAKLRTALQAFTDGWEGSNGASISVHARAFKNARALLLQLDKADKS